jgi:cytosine/creatinine deaminase
MDATQLPADIDPESLSRLPLVERGDLDADGQRLHDAIAEPTRQNLAGFRGPAGLGLHSPRLGALMRQANALLRFETSLAPRLRELAILVTAREMDQQFEWTMHEPAARTEGLSQDVIDVVKHRRPLAGVPATEAALIALGREIFRERRVGAATYADAVRRLGRTDVINVVNLMANYAGTAVVLTAFDQQLHPGQSPLLPLDRHGVRQTPAAAALRAGTIDPHALLSVAIDEARQGLAEGGIPIGAALFHHDGRLLGRGHNRRVQESDPSVHGETDAFRKAGRQRRYRDTIMVTTLAPCWYCSGLVRQFNVGALVVGESVNFEGGVAWLRRHGIEVVDLASQECITMLADYTAANPDVWNEDIGED